MIEVSQIPEIAVLSEGILGIGRAHGKTSANEDRDGVRAHGFEQLLTSFGEHAGSLSHPATEGVAGLARRRSNPSSLSIEMLTHGMQIQFAANQHGRLVQVSEFAY